VQHTCKHYKRDQAQDRDRYGKEEQHEAGPDWLIFPRAVDYLHDKNRKIETEEYETDDRRYKGRYDGTQGAHPRGGYCGQSHHDARRAA